MTPDEAVVVRQLLGLVVERVHGPGVDDIVKRTEELLSPDPCVIGGVEVRALTAKQLGIAASDDDSYRSVPGVGDGPAEAPADNAGWSSDAAPTPDGDTRGMHRALDQLRVDCGDLGEIIAQEVNERGYLWWSATRVYGAKPKRREIRSLPRNPSASSAGDNVSLDLVVGKAGVPIDAYDAMQILATRPDHPSRLLAEKARAVADWVNDPPLGSYQREQLEEVAPDLVEKLFDLLGGGPGDVSDVRPAGQPARTSETGESRG